MESEELKDDTECPFCEGNESMTPPEIVALRENGGANESGWSVRVIPNKFPALRIEGSVKRRGIGIYDSITGVGAHEVIVESPGHDTPFDGLSPDHATNIYRVLQERLVDLMRDERFKYVILFKNQGGPAGATLRHPHHQVIATPITPKTVAMELVAAREHFRDKERCIFCDIIDQEIESGERIVETTDRFVAFTPYASRSPYEVFVGPRYHEHSMTETSEDDLAGLADIMQRVLRRLRLALNDPPYNYVIHNAPNTSVKPKRASYWSTIVHDFHWHIEILPRLTRVAGFEWGTGFYINPKPPEEAAEHLRSIE